MTRRSVPALIPFLVFVSAVFIGILIYAYVEAKRANPQMLDENGRIKAAALHRRGVLKVYSACPPTCSRRPPRLRVSAVHKVCS
jgi:hypothetical protein